MASPGARYPGRPTERHRVFPNLWTQLMPRRLSSSSMSAMSSSTGALLDLDAERLRSIWAGGPPTAFGLEPSLAGASPMPRARIARDANSSATAPPRRANPAQTNGENTNDVKKRPIATPIRPTIMARPGHRQPGRDDRDREPAQPVGERPGGARPAARAPPGRRSARPRRSTTDFLDPRRVSPRVLAEPTVAPLLRA